jgi:hypothetical protein
MATQKMQTGGKTGYQLKKEGMALKQKGHALKKEGMALKNKGIKMKSKTAGDALDALVSHIKSFGVYKTGGMVNSNAKISALKSAGSKGVKSGVNPKAAASKVAKGRVGGTSTAPKTALPKAKYGMSMKGKKSC